MVRKLRLFLASPNDVMDERARIELVVNEVNRTVANQINLVIDLIRWETHARPGVGVDGQDVINRQMPGTDIFLGVMWKRLGTRTGRAKSGTVEEFQRFWAEHSIGERDIMFYFCQRPFYSAEHEDVAQFRKVLDFRSELQVRGLLVWGFVSTDEFERSFREHLIAKVLNIGVASGSIKALRVGLTPPTPADGDFEHVLLKEMRRGDTGLVYFDVDNSKRLNEQFGKVALDLAIGAVRDKVDQVVGRRGLVYRYFGDEFAIILPNTSTEEAAATAERVRREVEASTFTKSAIPFTVSCGVGSAHHDQARTFLEAARRACFVSKLKGKNRVTVLPLSVDDNNLLAEIYGGCGDRILS